MVRPLEIIFVLLFPCSGCFTSTGGRVDLSPETPQPTASASSDTVHVAPPTGGQAADRASILAALERVPPGGTVQFAAGTYLIGGFIRVARDEITLLGHPHGTVIRGCEPDAFPAIPAALFACNGFELTGARQTVRNLSLEYAWHGLFVGCCFPADEEALESGGVGALRSQPGGHLIESNTLRYTPNGLRVIGESADPTVVRDNRFIDVYHAVQINGGAAHVLDNDITVRNPERVPTTNYPGDAINILPFSSMLDLRRSPMDDHTSCSGNVIARNRIVGYPDGIRIAVPDPQSSCRRNTIRDNTIIVRRSRWSERRNGPRVTDEADSTIVGVPLRLINPARSSATEGEPASDALSEDNLIEGNYLIGAEGVGMEIFRASGNRILNNTITGVRRREPFPGNTLGGEPERWRDANGSGIWLSPGSDGNEIVGNTFEDIATYTVALEGDQNRVELRSPSDAVRDLGSSNRVISPGTSTEGVQRIEPPYHGQGADAPRYDSRFVEANGIRLQYMDFGGSGLPLIFVQDIHNYFEDEDPYFRDVWARFYARFTGDHRVLATVKRGYGESDDPGWGYDVATQSEDLLGLMDALGIRRAVLVGRVPATQDLTWIAEHHPERVAGLVYLGNPVVLQSGQDPEARLFGENYARGSCDLEERGIALGGARTSWRPHFLDDDTVRIDVPALRFTHPEYDRRSMDLQRLDRLDEIAEAEPGCPGEARSLEYFRALAADADRRAALRQVLEESDPSVPIDEGMERAFGTRMRTVVEPDLEGGWPAFHDFIEPHVRRFLAEVRDSEGIRAGKGAGAVAEDTPWTSEELQQRAALIYVQHVAFSLTGARDEGRKASDQGRRVGEIVARYKRRLLWDGSSNALLANALAKLIDPEYQVEFGRATFTLRSRYQRAARELAHYGSSIDEYVAWLEAMHDAIGPVQGYAMTARLDGEWLVETYRDLPNRKELEPATDLPLYELRPEEFGIYEGVYTGTIVGDTASVEWTMRVWQEDRRLRITTWRSGEREPYGRHLVPLAEDVFLPGWYPEEGPPEVPRNARVRFAPTEAGPAEWVELQVEGEGETILWRLRRLR